MGLIDRASRGLVVATVLCLCALGDAMGQTVVLRSAARVEAGRPLVLTDLARVTGSGGDELAKIELAESAAMLMESGARFVEIDADAVRERLEARGVPTGGIAISGGPVIVRMTAAAEPAEAAPRVVSEQTIDDAGADARMDPPLHTAPTVERAIRERIESQFAIDEPLRLMFDEADTEFLATEAWAGRIVVEPLSVPSGGRDRSRLIVRVRVYRGDVLAEDRSVTIEAQVQRPVLMSTAPLRRGERVSPTDVSVERRWLAVGGDRVLSTLDEIEGVVLRRSVPVGEVLEPSHVEKPIAVRRNELITVLALRGGVELKTRGRAMEEGVVGEWIECRLARDSQSFLAEIVEPGVVMLRDGG